MKHLLAPVLALMLLAAPAHAEGLKVAGDVVTVVRGFPVTVTAPEGAGLYFWDAPDAVRASGKLNVLTVTAAPEGAHPIRVTAVTARVREDRAVVFDQTTYQVVLTVGKLPPPPGPQPGPTPPAPVDPLVKELQAAYDADQDRDKGKHLDAYAALYRQAAAFDLAQIKTVGQMFAWLLEARRKLAPDGVLTKTRAAVQGKLEDLVGKKAADELSFEQKQRLTSLFARLGEALSEVKK